MLQRILTRLNDSQMAFVSPPESIMHIRPFQLAISRLQQYVSNYVGTQALQVLSLEDGKPVPTDQLSNDIGRGALQSTLLFFDVLQRAQEQPEKSHLDENSLEIEITDGEQLGEKYKDLMGRDFQVSIPSKFTLKPADVFGASLRHIYADALQELNEKQLRVRIALDKLHQLPQINDVRANIHLNPGNMASSFDSPRSVSFMHHRVTLMPQRNRKLDSAQFHVDVLMPVTLNVSVIGEGGAEMAEQKRNMLVKLQSNRVEFSEGKIRQGDVEPLEWKLVDIDNIVLLNKIWSNIRAVAKHQNDQPHQ